MTDRSASNSGDLNIMEDIVKSKIGQMSGYIYGFADLRGFLAGEFSRFSLGLSIGKRLNDQIVNAVVNGPTLEYYNHFSEVNQDLEATSGAIAFDLANHGIKCVAVVPTLPLAGEEFRPHLKNLRYKLSHKMVATRAGLGWIGKTGLFVSEAFGPRLRLVSILIESNSIPAATPTEESKCGSCNICVKQCPAQAANGISWNIHIDRDEFFNAHKCREKCLEYGRHMLGMEKGVCGICVAVCPHGQSNDLLRNSVLPTEEYAYYQHSPNR